MENDFPVLPVIRPAGSHMNSVNLHVGDAVGDDRQCVCPGTVDGVIPDSLAGAEAVFRLIQVTRAGGGGSIDEDHRLIGVDGRGGEAPVIVFPGGGDLYIGAGCLVIQLVAVGEEGAADQREAGAEELW